MYVMTSRIYTPLILFFLFAFIQITAFAQNANDLKKSVPLWFEYNEGENKAVLKWMNDPGAATYNVGMVDYTGVTPTYQSLATVQGGIDSFEIKNFSSGQRYHYRVSKPTGVGFIDFGIKQPLSGFKGRCLLVLNDRFTSTLQNEIEQWKSDIIGDGWLVDTAWVKSEMTPVETKAVIQAWYQSKNDAKTVVLFGAIPVPYSGNSAIDGHPDHSGAWSSDTYYGDMNGNWTDAFVNSTAATRQENKNIPGDGKFDAIVIPSDLELEIGRIDFSKLPAFPQSEEELLKQYLYKNHLWRTAQNPYPKRALMENNFASFDEGFGQNAWRNFVPMFGPDSVVAGNYDVTLATDKYLYTYACGGGSYTSCGGIGTTQNLWVAKSIQSVFTMTFGSYFGDYDSQNNFLRAALGSGDILTNMWAGRPNWVLSSMASGAHIGHAARLTQNANGGFFYSGFGPRYTHVALMGDPTLRLHPVPMVRNLTALQEGSKINLSWENTDPEQNLFAVYLVNDESIQLLDMVENENSYTIQCPTPNAKMTIMVKAVELTETASGSYYNGSTGLMTEISVDPDGFPTADFNVAAEFESVSFENLATNATVFEWSFGDGSFSSDANPSHVYGTEGTYQVCLNAHNGDDCQGAELCREIVVLSSLPDKVNGTVKNVSCFGGNDGAIVIETEGGSETHREYSWSHGATTPNIENLTAGSYTLKIISSITGDSIKTTFEISQPEELVVLGTPTKSTGNNGKIDLQISGGTEPYQITWTGPGQPSTLENLAPGTYYITVQDANNCLESISVVVEMSTSVQETAIQYVIYPNPVKDKFTISLPPSCNYLVIRNVEGKTVYTKSDMSGLNWEIDATTWHSGLYTIDFEHDSKILHSVKMIKL